MGRRIGPLLFAIAAIVLWLSSRATWVTAHVEDELSGAQTLPLIGSFWSLELMGLTLLLLAGVLAGLALRRIGRRIVGIIAALAGAAVAWGPLQLLTRGADPQRAQDLLRASEANQNAVDNVTISSWAQVVSADVAQLGPICAVAAGAAAVFGGVLLAMQPGGDKPRSHKYETSAAREEALAEDLRNSPDSGRVMWDALDADIDPTDLPHQK